MKACPTVRSLTGIALVVLASAFLLYCTVLSWAMRDGMGPGSSALESHSSAALIRFLKEVWLFVVIALPVAALGASMARKRKAPIQLPVPTRGNGT